MRKRTRRARRVPSQWDAWAPDEREPDAKTVELREGTPTGGPWTTNAGCSHIRPLYETES